MFEGFELLQSGAVNSWPSSPCVKKTSSDSQRPENPVVRHSSEGRFCVSLSQEIANSTQRRGVAKAPGIEVLRSLVARGIRLIWASGEWPVESDHSERDVPPNFPMHTIGPMRRTSFLLLSKAGIRIRSCDGPGRFQLAARRYCLLEDPQTGVRGSTSLNFQ